MIFKTVPKVVRYFISLNPSMRGSVIPHSPSSSVHFPRSHNCYVASSPVMFPLGVIWVSRFCPNMLNFFILHPIAEIMSNWFFSPKTDREFSNELETETVPELNCILKQRAILFTRSLQRFRNPQSLLYSFS